MPKLQESGMIDPAYEEEINYEGPSGLIDRAGDTLSAAFVERLRGMAAAQQHGAGDASGG